MSWAGLGTTVALRNGGIRYVNVVVPRGVINFDIGLPSSLWVLECNLLQTCSDS